MGYQSNVRATQSQDDAWKAQGFLNLYLPSADGGRVKLGAIALKDSNAREKKLMDGMKVSEAEMTRIVAAIQSKLIIEFRTSEPKEGSNFAI